MVPATDLRLSCCSPLQHPLPSSPGQTLSLSVSFSFHVEVWNFSALSLDSGVSWGTAAALGSAQVYWCARVAAGSAGISLSTEIFGSQRAFPSRPVPVARTTGAHSGLKSAADDCVNTRHLPDIRQEETHHRFFQLTTALN